jgi:hypothetical protein
MNFLSHHYVARSLAPAAPAVFYVGNVLPDLLARRKRGEAGGSGGRLRANALARCADPDLAGGIGLHLAADRRFHGSALFRSATAEAGALLREAVAPRLSRPLLLRRVFFLAHVFVEISLDAVLIRSDPALASDLYARFAAVDREFVAGAVAPMLGGAPVPGLAARLAHFETSRFLLSYAADEGLVEALHGLSLAAGLAGFTVAADRGVIAGAFTAFLPRAAALGPALWARAAGSGAAAAAW